MRKQSLLRAWRICWRIIFALIIGILISFFLVRETNYLGLTGLGKLIAVIVSVLFGVFAAVISGLRTVRGVKLVFGLDTALNKLLDLFGEIHHYFKKMVQI